MRMIKKFSALILVVALLLTAIPVANSVTTYAEQTSGNVARDVVGEGMVLLKNDNNALPLSSNSSIAVFGKAQLRIAGGYYLGGGGSGTMYLDYTPMGPGDYLMQLSKEGKVSVYEPLYEAYLADNNYTPTNAMYEAASAAADTAVMFIGRSASEGGDTAIGSWSLNWKEKEILQKVSQYFEKVVVCLNTPNPICVDWSVDGNEYGIEVDSLLQMYMPGEYGIYGMADILFGEINPSGKLVDTYAYDIYDYPSVDSYVDDEYLTPYTEDIFVGYRYFETFAKDKVVYEFGFGKSYTTFDITTDSVTNDGENITVTATVKNTGDVAGKETVQVYYSAPQKNEGTAILSKAAIELGNYKKTELLAPGQSQTLEISFAINDMASYDDLGLTGNKSCYLLEAGDYDIFVGNSVRNNTKEYTYTVDALTVTEKLSQMTETELTSRLEADGSYTDPSIPLLENGQQYIYGYKPTVIEGESYVNSLGTYTGTPENYKTNGYLYDGFEWHKVAANSCIGNLQSRVGQYITYSLYVGEEGTYNLGFTTSNGIKTVTKNEDILGVEVSYDGGATYTAADISIDSLDTGNYQSATGYRWFNFRYDDADLQGNKYSLKLKKGEMLVRLKVLSGASGCNTNIDKIFFCPENISFTVADVCEHYGVAFNYNAVISSDAETWLEAENYNDISGCATEDFASGSGFLYNGESYVAVGSGKVLGSFQGKSGNFATYKVYAEESGLYNLGLTLSNGYEGKTNVNDALKVSVSTNGTTFTEQALIDSENTNAAGTGALWWNFKYNDKDFDGKNYTVNLTKGYNLIKIESTDNAVTVGCVNIDKIVLFPENYEFIDFDVYDCYKIEYNDDFVSTTEATWFEAESFSATANRVSTENFSAGYGFLYDGNSYVPIGAGTCVGNFDKAEGGYVQYAISLKNAATFNIGLTTAKGMNSDSTNGEDVLVISYSSDGGATWTEAPVKVDVKHTKNVGTGQSWWNFYYNDADYEGNKYTISLPKGNIILRFTNTANARTCGGPNIDKFVLIPEGVAFDQEQVNIYHGIAKEIGVSSSEATWFEAEDCSVKSGLNIDTVTTGGYFYNGTEIVALPAGKMLGNFGGAVGNYAEYRLTANQAGNYKIIFSAGNGMVTCEDIIAITVSSDGGETFSEPVLFDSIGTRYDHSKRWWNMRYHGEDFQGNEYIVELPKGEFVLRFTSTENATLNNKQGSVNIDKFAIVPASVEYGFEETVAFMEEFIKNENRLEIDFDADNYVGITYADILSGEHSWDELLAQMSYNELIDLLGGHYGSWSVGWTGMIGFSTDARAEKYGIYSADTMDGGAGIRSPHANTTWIPNATLQASTWNPELLYKLGLLVGDNALDNSADMWLAPGMNIHRAPLGGRNFEYYAEDPVVTANTAIAIITAVQSKGIACTVKHFCCQHRELNRKYQNSLVSERALREIYLVAFRKTIKEANPTCIMTSYNMLNGNYTSADTSLLRTVVRGEWGYKGLIMSDWDEKAQHVDQILAGNNTKMVSLDTANIKEAIVTQTITRDMLEEHAYYILSNIAKMPDTEINTNRVTSLSLRNTNTIDSYYFTNKTMNSRFIYENGNYLAPGLYNNTFYEYKVSSPVEAEYSLSINYTSETDVTAAFQIYVNGALVDGISADLTAADTGISVANITLPKGESTIKLMHKKSSTVYYDSLTLTSTTEFTQGDVNLDGYVDICDLVCVDLVISAVAEQTEFADVNLDGTVNYDDTEKIRTIILSSIK